MPSAQILPFQHPDKGYPPLPLEPALEDSVVDIRRLRRSHYRQHAPSALEAGKRFRRIFQGPFHHYFRFKRERTHANLIRLLIGQRLAENKLDAERFISDILGAQLYLDATHHKYCTLERVPKKDAYCLWYVSY